MDHTDMQFSILLVGDELTDWKDYLKEADDAGFRRLGVGDSQSLYQDAYIRCAIAASETRNLEIGPLVTNPVTRHPAVTAGAISTVDQVAQGRGFLGIGSGDSALLNIGQTQSRLNHLKVYIEAVNDLMDKGEATWCGEAVRSVVPKRRVPIYVAAAGPRVTRLAGELADGVILGSGITEEAVRDALKSLQEGADAVGRRMEDIDIWWLVMTNICEDSNQALKEIRNSLTTHAHATFAGGLKGKAVPPEFEEGLLRIVEQYRPMEHAKYGGRHHVGLLEDRELETYLKERFAICGSPREVVSQIEAARAAGAKKLWFSVRVPNKRRVLSLWRESVLPEFSHVG